MFRAMAHRVFHDAHGVEWQVWAVIPTMAERLLSSVPARSRAPLRPELRSGWLAFQSGTARRRRAPIPDEWDTMSEEGLRAELARAVPVSDSRRLLD